jgi:segregation and condensation protein B
VSHEAPTAETLLAIVGAVAFATDEPAAADEIASALGVERGEVEQAIETLRARLARQEIGLVLEAVAGGVRLATRAELAPWVRRFFQHRNRARLSLPALETLAIIAYRQPVTAPEIQAIRGKDPTAALKGLLDRRLVRILGRKKVVGSPILYGTSRDFLLHFGLDDLGDLPRIEEFEQFLGVLEERQSSVHAAGAEEPPPEPHLSVAPDDGG